MFPTALPGLPTPPLASPKLQRPMVGQTRSSQGLSADAATLTNSKRQFVAPGVWRIDADAATLTNSKAPSASKMAWLFDTERATAQRGHAKAAPASETNT